MDNVTRRDALLTGLALSTAALTGCGGGGGSSASPPSSTAAEAAAPGATPAPTPSSQKDTLLAALPPYYPGTERLASDEMRISFMGTSFLPRMTQACNSVFVELGNGDSFVFDCGSGVVSRYTSMQIQMSRMDKIFITHLHGDHTSDLTHLYCFGCQEDRKSPLYVWGPSASNVPDPVDGTLYDDGAINFCKLFREFNRWHTESQSFVGTRYVNAPGDGYDIAMTELNWQTGDASRTWATLPALQRPGPAPWIAYRENGVTIRFFPAVHGRNGSISYRLDWNGRSMIFTGDTKPNNFLVEAATVGVDVLIHEVAAPPETWAVKLTGITDPTNPIYQAALLNSQAVQANSHTPAKALGYILSQLKKKPRLAVATHYQAEDDIIGPALQDIRLWYDGAVTFSGDLMVVNVTSDSVKQRRAIVSDYAWYPPPAVYADTALPKYNDTSANNPYNPMAPLAQFSQGLLDGVIDPSLYNAR